MPATSTKPATVPEPQETKDVPKEKKEKKPRLSPEEALSQNLDKINATHKTNTLKVIAQYNKSKGKTARRAKPPRDKNHPRGAMSNYFIYMGDVREDFKEKYPTAAPKELTGYMSASWRGLSDEEKRPFTERAVADRERYNAEMDVYKAKKAAKEDSSEDGGESDSEEEEPPKSKKRKATEAPKAHGKKSKSKR